MNTHENPAGLSPVSLAFVGDGIFELMVRERLVARGGMPAGKLHKVSVSMVRAAAQAAAYPAVREAATQAELEVLRRGRNVSLSRMPKSCTPDQYHKATAIEALLGYLYLGGQRQRLEEMFELIMTAQREELSGEGE